jgi:hypothetical protein
MERMECGGQGESDNRIKAGTVVGTQEQRTCPKMLLEAVNTVNTQIRCNENPELNHLIKLGT